MFFPDEFSFQFFDHCGPAFSIAVASGHGKILGSRSNARRSGIEWHTNRNGGSAAR